MSSDASINLIDLISEDINTKTFKSTDLPDPLIQSKISENDFPLNNNPFDVELYKAILLDDPFELAEQKNNEITKKNLSKSKQKSDTKKKGKENLTSPDELKQMKDTSIIPSLKTLASNNCLKNQSSESNKIISLNINPVSLTDSLEVKNFQNGKNNKKVNAEKTNNNICNDSEIDNLKSITINLAKIGELCPSFNKSNSHILNSTPLDSQISFSSENIKNFESEKIHTLLSVKEEKILKKRRSKFLQDSFENIIDTEPVLIESESETENSFKISNISINHESTQKNGDSNLGTRLEEIREKLNKYKQQMNEESQVIMESPQNTNEKTELIRDKEINNLITSLKNVLLKCNDEAIIKSASALLENLSSALAEKRIPIPPVIRQDTFDIDKSSSNTMLNDINKSSLTSTLDTEGPNKTQTCNISSKPSNSTYTVTQDKRKPLKRQLTQIVDNFNAKGDKSKPNVRRSWSCGTYDKPGLLNKTKINSSSKFTTPAKSNKNTLKPLNSSKTKEIPKRTPIYTPVRKTAIINPTERQNTLDVNKSLKKKIDNNFSKFKIKATSVIKKLQGPLKGNVSVKKLTTQFNKFSPKSNANSKTMITSTPIITVPTRSNQAISSTPPASTVNTKSQDDNKRKSSQRYISTTPKEKGSPILYSNRRRSLTDFKSKKLNSDFNEIAKSSKMQLPSRKTTVQGK